MPTRRPLGLYEKYALAMHGLNKAPAVVVSALLPSSDLLDSSNFLTSISTLLAREPHLRSSIIDPRTPQPIFKLNEDVKPEQVLVELGKVAPSTEQALLDAMESLSSLDVEKAPLWRVWVYAEDPQTKLRRIVLGIHHILCDGTGAKHLFSTFLSSLRSTKGMCTLPRVEETIPPTLEETVDIRPSIFTLLRVGFSEFVVPKLPSFLQPRSIPFWPNPAIVPPRDQPTAIKLLFLPTDVSASLSTTPKSHRVKTLHPLLVVSALSSIANAVFSSCPDPKTTSIDIQSQTPVSLRSPSLGHPLLTSNYVSSIPHLVSSITPSYLSSTSFWSLTRSFAEHLRSPSSHQSAKEGMGMLTYIPNGDPAIVLKEGEKTSWEEWLDKRMTGENPWKSGSFEFSNLGRIIEDEEGSIRRWLEEGMRDVCWAQPASASGSGLQFNAISCGGMLSISLTWRKDSIDQEVVDKIWNLFGETLRKVSRGEVSEGTSLAELR
ncbi:hypothetical protein JCM3765_007339 [Sporobolomyces pararoseus]